MVQNLLRRVLGAVKDQASIGIAKVNSTKSLRIPALEIAIVKATSHDELVVVEEKHVREIVQIMSFSRGHASVCVSLLAKRLSKTRNWVVALKVLLVIHRLLLQDSSVIDSSFEDELMLASRRMLHLPGFRDDTRDPLAQLCSAFVRNYALYIDEWLDCFVLGAASQENAVHQAGCITIDYNDYRMDYSTYKQDESNLFQQQEHAKNEINTSSSEADAKVAMLLKRIPVLQHLLEHVLGCSVGVEVQHPLVRSALTLILRDSFRVYADVCDGMSTLLNEFFLMIHKDGLKTYAVYSRLGKQAEALDLLYGNCRGMGMCGGAEYPSVQKVSHEHLVLLDDYLKDNSRKNTEKVDETETQEEDSEDSVVAEAQIIAASTTLVDENKTAEPSVTQSSSWETFDAGSVGEATLVEANESTAAGIEASAAAAADWEVALMNEAKKLSYSLSKGRSTSLSLTSSSSSNRMTSGRLARSRVPLLSMSAIPYGASNALDGDDMFHMKKIQQKQHPNDMGRIGIGSPGSYGKMMNKHSGHFLLTARQF